MTSGQRAQVQVMTKDALVKAVWQKNGCWGAWEHYTASMVADLIQLHGLEMVIAGRHDNKPVTFERAYEIVFGERLRLKR